ncbi:MAG: nucleotide exchange factor GrpE [Candidatus Omnitrophica bacterium]|nr:nucleotide exchange factor GrpE [Candidatus Omnitrophota bacterium]
MAEKETKNNKTNGDKVTISKEEYDHLLVKSKEADDLQDKFLRAHAEFENAKKRLEKDKIDYLRFANDSFLLEFLPILDSLEIAEKHIKEAKDFKAVQEGVDMIQLQIQKFLKDIGVERVKTVGEKFDPHMHEAVETEEVKDRDDGLILQELKPGYRVNGRLLRPASVKISKKK